MYLVMKKVPKSVYKAGEELWFTKQRTDKPGGPQALSGQAELSGEWLTTNKHAQSIYLQTCVGTHAVVSAFYYLSHFGHDYL